LVESLLLRWLREKRGKLRDVQVKVDNMVFHLPFDGKKYLMFKCVKCGYCCRHLLNLPLTFQDISRLSKGLNYPDTSTLLDKECVYGEIKSDRVYPLIQFPPFAVRGMTWFLKRFEGENEETLNKPAGCRFLTEDNLCSIYPCRPSVCRKSPYTLYKVDGTYHAYYIAEERSECQGYKEKPKPKLKWLTPWVGSLIQGYEEVVESLETGVFKLTEIRQNLRLPIQKDV